MRTLLMAMAAAATATTFALPARAADNVTVAVTAIVEHPALDACRDGVKEALANAGYVEGKNLTFLYESAQGNPATAAQIARQFIGDSPNVIVPISTPSAQAVVTGTRDIPVVFSAISDPVSAKLVKNLDKPGGNVTGVSDMSPMKDQVALIKEIVPEAKTVGIIYNPGEANSVALLETFKKEASKLGFKTVESPATKSSEVMGAARALIGKADAIYVPTDNTIISALEGAVQVAEQNKVPLFTGDTDSVMRGALAAVGFNYFDVGMQTGDLVVKILKGAKPGDLPVIFAKGTNLVVNPASAKKMGVTLPQAVLDRASTIVE